MDVLLINPGNSREIYQELSVYYSAIEPQHGHCYWLNHVAQLEKRLLY